MSKRIKVMLKKGHPHADEIGYINANENGGFDVTYSYEGAPPMMKVDLENCPHKAKGCYAMQKDCILLAVEVDMGKFQEFLQEMLDKIISIRDETCARFNAWLDEYFGFDMSDLDELGAEEDE